MSTRTVPVKSYIALLELAVANPIRTPQQQTWLVEECNTINNVFVDWSEWARRSWTAKPCEGCETIIEVTDGPICDDCARYEAAHPLDLPGLCSP